MHLRSALTLFSCSSLLYSSGHNLFSGGESAALGDKEESADTQALRVSYEVLMEADFCIKVPRVS